MHLKSWWSLGNGTWNFGHGWVPPKTSKLAKIGWLSITTSSPYWGDHPISHHLGGTVQALKREPKIPRSGFGLFRVRPLEMWQEVNGSCSLDLNSQEIKKIDQFLPRRRHPELSETFPSVLLSSQELSPSPSRRKSKAYEGRSPSDKTWGGCRQ